MNRKERGEQTRKENAEEREGLQQEKIGAEKRLAEYKEAVRLREQSKPPGVRIREEQAKRLVEYVNQKVYETRIMRNKKGLHPITLVLVGVEIYDAFRMSPEAHYIFSLHDKSFQLQDLRCERAVDSEPTSLRFFIELPHERIPQ